LGLFNNRVNVNLDIYNSKTKDLLFSRTLPITSAITAWGSPMTTWQNIGETSNKGYEIQLSTVNIRNKDFEWRSSLSYTHNKEKIVNLPDANLKVEIKRFAEDNVLMVVDNKTDKTTPFNLNPEGSRVEVKKSGDVIYILEREADSLLE
jgi:hypothetical protein